MARSTSAPHRQVIQAKGLLWAAKGVANEEIARRCGVDSDSVRAWRRRFEEKGVAGVVKIGPGRGRKSWLPEGTVGEVIRLTLAEECDDTSTHWTTQARGAVGVGKDTVARIWRFSLPLAGVRPGIDSRDCGSACADHQCGQHVPAKSRPQPSTIDRSAGRPVHRRKW